MESRKIDTPRAGLLHVVGHDDNRVMFPQIAHQVFDLQGSDWVKRGARLIHQDDFRLDRQRPRDTEALLLAADSANPDFLRLSFHVIPHPPACRKLRQTISASWCLSRIPRMRGP